MSSHKRRRTGEGTDGDVEMGEDYFEESKGESAAAETMVPFGGRLQEAKFGLLKDTAIRAQIVCYACGLNFQVAACPASCFTLIGDDCFAFCSSGCRSKGL